MGNSQKSICLFWPVWFSAGSSASEYRCDCTMILMSFVERPYSKIAPEKRRKKYTVPLEFHWSLGPACFREIQEVESTINCTLIFCLSCWNPKHQMTNISVPQPTPLFFSSFYSTAEITLSPVPGSTKPEQQMKVRTEDIENRHRQIEVPRGTFTDSSFRQAYH